MIIDMDELEDIANKQLNGEDLMEHSELEIKKKKVEKMVTH